MRNYLLSIPSNFLIHSTIATFTSFILASSKSHNRRLWLKLCAQIDSSVIRRRSLLSIDPPTAPALPCPVRRSARWWKSFPAAWFRCWSRSRSDKSRVDRERTFQCRVRWTRAPPSSRLAARTSRWLFRFRWTPGRAGRRRSLPLAPARCDEPNISLVHPHRQWETFWRCRRGRNWGRLWCPHLWCHRPEVGDRLKWFWEIRI